MHERRKTAVRERLDRVAAPLVAAEFEATARIRSIWGKAAASDCFSLALLVTYDRSIDEATAALRAVQRAADDAIARLELLRADLDEGRTETFEPWHTPGEGGRAA